MHLVLFNSPYASLWLILLIPLITGFYLLNRYRKIKLSNFAVPEFMRSLLNPRSTKVMWTKWIGWSLIWVLCSFALMEPFGNLRYPPIPQSEKSQKEMQPYYAPHEVLFLVDTSASMGVPDGYSGETRLDEAKRIMLDILGQLQGQTASLYAFTSVLSAIVPPTLDYLFLRLSIGELHLDEGDVGGTLFGPVLQSLREHVFSEPSQRRITLILLSDGGDTDLEGLKGKAFTAGVEQILSALPNPQQNDFKLFAIGIGKDISAPIPQVVFNGKPVLSKLESTILKDLAKKGGGKYYAAQEWKAWDLAKEITGKIEENALIVTPNLLLQREVSFENREDLLFDLYFQIPLGVAILFYFLNLLLPDVRRV